MKKALVIGGVTIDVLVETGSRNLKMGAKNDVHDVVFGVGGGATNVAVNLAKLDLDVSVCCAVGIDRESTVAIDYLIKSGINVSSVSKIDGSSTGRAVILIDMDGEVTVMAQRGANTRLDIADVFDVDHDLVYITSIPTALASQLGRRLGLHRDVRKKVVFNPGISQIETLNEDVFTLVRNADLVIVNLAEANSMSRAFGNSLCQSAYIDEVASGLLEAGLRATVITDGASGALFVAPGVRHFQAALPVGVRSTLGAGDAFGSTFAHYLFSDSPPEIALRLAAENAAAAVGRTDAHSGTLTRVELERRLKRQMIDA